MQQIGIRVPLIHGETVRKRLLEYDCIDTNLSFTRTTTHLIIPVKCNEKSIANILANLETIDYQIGVFDFESKRSKPRDLYEALKDKISEEYHKYIPKSYDLIGNIVIIEILPEILEYKYLIGETLISLFPSIKTVYRKKSAVSGSYRLRELELIAGEGNCTTVHVEHQIRIYVDVCKAYFSPRLGQEHYRVAQKCKDDEIIVDLFTGVGAFPLHIAKKFNARIYAVDINPNAIECLERSVKMNKLKGQIIPINNDCREFAKTFENKADKVIMNLPSHSHEYIDVLCSIIKPGGTVFFYQFVSDKVAEKEITQILNMQLDKYGWTISKVCTFHKVRESAPYELHACLEAEITPKWLL